MRVVGYALQLLGVARLDPDKREAIAFALSPIDQYRASVRVVAPLPVPSPIALAPVA